MTKYEVIKTIFKAFQFVCFLIILLYMIVRSRNSYSLNAWIIIGYLVGIALVILLTCITSKLYRWFPFLQKGYKLALTVILMSAFAFGNKASSLRSIIAFILMGISLVFLIVSLCFIQEDKINEIVMSTEFEERGVTTRTAGSYMKKYNIEKSEISEPKEIERKEVVIKTSVDNKSKSHLF